MINLKKIKRTAAPVIALTAALLTLTTIGALSTSQTIPLSGTITAINLGVFSDYSCTQPVTSLDFGGASPGSIVTQTVYVKNTGDLPETLTMVVDNWSPSGAGAYLTLSWNRQDTVLNVGIVTQATLTLTVEQDTGSLTTFSCDVTITGSE